MNLISFVNGNDICITMIVIINVLIGNWRINMYVCIFSNYIIAKSERPLKCKNKKSTKNLIN